MRLELAGEPPATSTLSAGHKRSISSSAETSSALRSSSFRVKDIPLLEGKSLKEAATYKTRWEIESNTSPRPLSVRERIAHAATGLRGTPLEMWRRRQNQPEFETWDEYTAWCRNLVKDPANRTIQAYLSLKDARQRPNQNVRELVSYLEELERDLPGNDEDKQNAWSLLAALRPDIRERVMAEHKEITGREQVVSAAQRQEELLKGCRRENPEAQASSKRDAGVSQGKTVRVFSKSYTSRRKEARREGSRDEPEPKALGEKRCFACNITGHLANACPTKARRAPRTESAGDADVFSEQGAAELPDHARVEHAIHIEEGKEVPYGPIYAVSAIELRALSEYLESSLGK